MSNLDSRFKKRDIPIKEIGCQQELLMSESVSDGVKIASKSLYKVTSVAEQFKGQDSSMYSLENLIDTGYISKLKEVQMHSVSPETLSNGIDILNKAIEPSLNQNSNETQS